VVLPGGGRTHVVGIDTADGELTQAFAPQSVTLRLADDLDVARGDVLAPADAPPVTGADLVGTVCWLSERAPAPGARVLVRIGTRTVRGLVRGVGSRLDIDTLTVDEGATTLALNEIGTVHVRLAEPVVLDAYAEHRRTGVFLLVDQADGSTLAAGMVGPSVLVAAPDGPERCRAR
jgi:sulfate adenylyltransferase subunit 1